MRYLFTAFFLFLGTASFAQQQTDKAAIERTILNYVEAFYEGDTAKLYQSLVPDLAKRGYFLRRDTVREAKMSFEQAVRLAQRWYKTQQIGPGSPKKITVFDILDKTASAKVEAIWGVDYFHLARINGRWMIINVLWQDYPAKP